MRLWLLLFIGIAVTARADDTRKADLSKLRNEARVAHLIEGVSDDIKEHRYEDALKKAEKAVALSPNDAIALNARGAALSRLKRYDEARASLTAAVKADPKSFPPRYNLAELLYLQKNYLDALAELSAIRSQFGAMPLIKFDIYMCFAAAGRKEDAAVALAELRYPQDGAAWYYSQAVDRLLSGKKAEAQRLMKVADAIHQDDAQPYRDAVVDFGFLK